MDSSQEIKENNQNIEVETITVAHLNKLAPFLKKLKLTPKMRKFCWYYSYNGFNGADAVRRAGYRAKKNTTLSIIANEYLKKPNIREGVGLVLADMLKDKKSTLEAELFKFYYNRAFYDPSMFVDINGRPVISNIEEIPKEWRICIDSIEERRHGKDGIMRTIHIKLADRDRNAEKLEKYIQMIKETITVRHEHLTPEQEKRINDVFDRVKDPSNIIPIKKVS